MMKITKCKVFKSIDEFEAWQVLNSESNIEVTRVVPMPIEKTDPLIGDYQIVELFVTYQQKD